MTALLVFVIVGVLAFRTIMYGIWTLKGKNYTGGVFVITLAASAMALAARYFFKA